MFDENGAAVNLMALNNAMMAAAAAANNTHPPIASSHPVSSGQMVVNQLLGAKDSRWLQLEVCREFQRGQCSRTDEDCKFAHPPPHVDIQNGRVTACYDSIKGRCTRDNPKCKYLHPPQHLKDQLLMNGKQHLAMKSLLCAQLTSSPSGMVANGYNPALPQLVRRIQQSHPLVSSVPMQYFSQLPSASLYPPLLGAANGGGPVLQPGAGVATVAAQSPPLSTAALQQLLLLQQQLQQQQQQQAAAAAALSANSGVQSNSALLVALALQQQQQQHAQMTASLSAGAAAGQLSAVDGSQQPVLPASSSRKRTAQVAGIGTEEKSGVGKQTTQGHADSERRERISTYVKDVGGSQSPNHATSPASNGASSVLAGSSAAVNLLAYQQQQQQLQYLQQCQLLGLATQTPTSSSSSNNMAVAPHLNMKRSAGDKNGGGIVAATNGAMYAAPLNPYLLQQIPAGYLQFNGQQIPPRY